MIDLLIKQGRVVDPTRGVDGVNDLAIDQGKIVAIAPHLELPARDTIDAAGQLVVPGLIDLHTHVYWGGTSIGVDPDEVARRSGCTTLVDAGTAGAANLLGFRRHVIERSQCRVVAYLNISFAGIYAFSRDVMIGECSDGRLLDARACLRAAREHAEVIVGIKVRVGRLTSGAWGIGPLDVALDVASELNLPLMAHLDQAPPSRREVLERLRPGDVLTHCYRPFPNAPIRGNEQIYPEVLEARERGVLFDIGHGMGSFGFATAQGMLAHGFLPDIISSDVHALSIDGPAFDLLVTMSKLLSLGMPLIDIVRAVTATPALAIGRSELGTLRPGAPADVTLLTIEEGEFAFQDAIGESFVGSQRFVLKRRIVGGRDVS